MEQMLILILSWVMSFFSSEEDEDESVEGEENGEKPQCLLCEYVMSELDGEVEDKQNQVQLDYCIYQPNLTVPTCKTSANKARYVLWQFFFPLIFFQTHKKSV